MSQWKWVDHQQMHIYCAFFPINGLKGRCSRLTLGPTLGQRIFKFNIICELAAEEQNICCSLILRLVLSQACQKSCSTTALLRSPRSLSALITGANSPPRSQRGSEAEARASGGRVVAYVSCYRLTEVRQASR